MAADSALPDDVQLPVFALAIAPVVLVIVANWKRFENVKDSINQGTMGSSLPIFNTASEVGYGAVIAALPAFLIVRDVIPDLFPDNPLGSLAVAVNVLAGITGSAPVVATITVIVLGSVV